MGQPVLGELQKAVMSTEQMQKQTQLALVTDAEMVICLCHHERRHRTLRPRWVTQLLTRGKFLS